MKNTILRYGTYGAITICVLFLASWFLLKGINYSLQEVVGYAGMVVSLAFVFFGIKHFRDKENDGKVSFGKALAIGLLITLITALAFGIIDVIYVKYINPDFFSEYYSYSAEQLKSNFSGEELAAKLEELEAQFELFAKPSFNFLIMSATVMIIGFIISLLSAVILQRK